MSFVIAPRLGSLRTLYINQTRIAASSPSRFFTTSLNPALPQLNPSKRVTTCKTSTALPHQQNSSYSTNSQQSPLPNNTMADAPEPTGLIANTGIELLTMGTPNGVKITMLLEELKEAYGKDYTWQKVNIMKNTQKEPWFTALCPNGRIPVIVDHDNNGFAVFEGMAILLYLTRKYDPEYKFSFPVDSNEYSEAEQWMAWQHGGIGPMQGQSNQFYRYAKEKIPWGINRYVGESERLYGVLNTRLEGRQYIVGEKFSIVDMNLLGWVSCALTSGLDFDAPQFANVRAWYDRCLERSGVHKGMRIPGPDTSPFENSKVRESLKTPEGKQQYEDLQKHLKDAQAKYGYKFTTP